MKTAKTAKAALIVVAAGSGERLAAGIEKPYVELDGRPLVWHCLATLDLADLFEQRIVVVAPGSEARFRAQILERFSLGEPVELVAGGATRQESVYRGLERLRDAIELVAIHDGARPCIDVGTVRASFAACAGVDGALVAVPVHDALKRVADHMVVEDVARAGLWRAQTPQTFHVEAIRAAHQAARAAAAGGGRGSAADAADAVDDVSLVLRHGGRVRVIQGSKTNLKVTEPGDVVLGNLVLRERRGARRDDPASESKPSR